MILCFSFECIVRGLANCVSSCVRVCACEILSPWKFIFKVMHSYLTACERWCIRHHMRLLKVIVSTSKTIYLTGTAKGCVRFGGSTAEGRMDENSNRISIGEGCKLPIQFKIKYLRRFLPIFLRISFDRSFRTVCDRHEMQQEDSNLCCKRILSNISFSIWDHAIENRFRWKCKSFSTHSNHNPMLHANYLHFSFDFDWARVGDSSTNRMVVALFILFESL